MSYSKTYVSFKQQLELKSFIESGRISEAAELSGYFFEDAKLAWIELVISEFKNLEKHPFFGKIFKKLTTKEQELCESFIRENCATSGDFSGLAARWFLDQENKPAKLSIMVELIISAYNIARNA